MITNFILFSACVANQTMLWNLLCFTLHKMMWLNYRLSWNNVSLFHTSDRINRISVKKWKYRKISNDLFALIPALSTSVSVSSPEVKVRYLYPSFRLSLWDYKLVFSGTLTLTFILLFHTASATHKDRTLFQICRLTDCFYQCICLTDTLPDMIFADS